MLKIKPKSFHLQWHITERCNLRCRHCYQDPVLMKDELEICDLVKILEKFIKQIETWQLPKETVRISLTGGEPLIRNDFLELLQKCYQNRDKFYYGILTNGTLLDEKKVKELKNLKLNYAQISLEGMEKTNDYLRGRGVFKKAVKAIELLKKENIAVNLSLTVSKANLREIPKIVDFSKKLALPLGIRRLVPSGRGEMLKKIMLSPKEVRRLWNYIQEVNSIYGNRVELGCEDGILVQDFPEYLSRECSAGYASFTVLPNGDVYSCRRLPIFVGNLLKESFQTIYNSKPFRGLRNMHNINDVCYLCPFYEKCFGGAKCLAFSYFKDASSPDPQCWRLFEKLPDPKMKWKNSGERRKERLNRRWVEATT